MASLAAQILPLLESRFPGRNLRASVGAAPFAVFPAVHPDVGSIEIHDDGDELTVVVGKFTHSHFGNYDEGISEQERATRIGDALVGFFNDLFADRIEMYGSQKGGGGARLRERGERGILSRAFFGPRSYVWSGPLGDDV